MTKSRGRSLDYAVLGLIFQSPKSGYDIRKIFAQSPLKMFSPSPGSVYPALHRLAGRRLLEIAASANATGRRKELFALTQSGKQELSAWLREPIASDDIVWSLGELQLKFAFIGDVLGLDAAIDFLTQLERGLSAHLDYLERYLAGVAEMQSLYGRLAFECGIQGYRTQVDWTKHALGVLMESKRKQDHEA